MINPFEIPEEAEYYLGQNTTPEDNILKEVSRYTWLNEVHPQMISGQVQGWFYRIISQILKPEHILEIGTFTGYSTIALAAGLKENGRITTIEINDEYEAVCKRHFAAAGIGEQTNLLIGNALDLLPELEEQYDLVLIDAQKELYCEYFRLIREKIRPGGIILADNVLWGGKVVTTPSDPTARAVNAFNELVTADESFENVLLPLRDGIMMLLKR